MSRPESEHTLALRAFRDRLVAARRSTARMDDLDAAMRRFIEIETAIGLVEKAIDNEMDLTPIPRIDDPTAPPPFPDSNKGPPIIERL
jgi:hypothetical protein